MCVRRYDNLPGLRRVAQQRATLWRHAGDTIRRRRQGQHDCRRPIPMIVIASSWQALKLTFHGTIFPRSILVTSSRGCPEDATRKTVPWNLSYRPHRRRSCWFTSQPDDVNADVAGGLFTRQPDNSRWLWRWTDTLTSCVCASNTCSCWRSWKVVAGRRSSADLTTVYDSCWRAVADCWFQRVDFIVGELTCEPDMPPATTLKTDTWRTAVDYLRFSIRNGGKIRHRHRCSLFMFFTKRVLIFWHMWEVCVRLRLTVKIISMNLGFRLPSSFSHFSNR